MNKSEILEKYPKQEDKLLISKLLDKIELCRKRNIITTTEFLDLYQKSIVEKVLKIVKCNFVFFGGYNGANRVMLIIYPEKLTKEMVEENYKNYMEIIRIELPKNLHGDYAHKDYLSGVMKLGIRREKFGDIIVQDTGADIIVSKDISEYIKENISDLTRFSKATIDLIDIDNIKNVEIKKEEFKIIIPSLRLDSVVAQLVNTSRTKATEIILSGRVFINYENELKIDKQVKEKDIIVIRGKGKFEIVKIEGNTRKNKQIVLVNKYV